MRRLFSFRTVKLLGKLFVVFVALVVLSLVIFNLHGKRSYLAQIRAHEAAGETYDPAKLLHKPVPASENFAMTPLLAPFLDYRRVNKEIVWKQRELVTNLQSGDFLSVTRGKGAGPDAGNWEIQRTNDLSMWQDYYRNNSAFNLPEKSGTPAQDILAAHSIYDAELKELREAARRPHAFFPLHEHTMEAFQMLLPHLAFSKRLSQLLRLHAVAALENGDPNLALEDLRLGHRMVGALLEEPLLISHLVAIADASILAQPVWEGLVKRQWKEQHLVEIQKLLESRQFVKRLPDTMRGERALANAGILAWIGQSGMERRDDIGLFGDDSQSAILAKAPGGIFYHNLVAYNQHFNEFVNTLEEFAGNDGQGLSEVTDFEKRSTAKFSRTRWNQIFIKMLMPALSNVVHKSRRADAVIKLQILGCALERHRFQVGKYPAGLAELAPRFIEKVPNDPCSGEPFIYELEKDGIYRLYSAGVNGLDDGGMISYNQKGTGILSDKGDVVWTLRPE